MKYLPLLFVMLVAGWCNAGEPVKRLHAIEKKFSLNYSHTEQHSWEFVLPYGLFGSVPVVVPENATDHDVFVAVQATINCAVFYEEVIKAAAQQKTLDNVSVED